MEISGNAKKSYQSVNMLKPSITCHATGKRKPWVHRAIKSSGFCFAYSKYKVFIQILSIKSRCSWFSR